MILLSSATPGEVQNITTGLQNNGIKVGLQMSSEKTIKYKATILGEHQAMPLTVEQKDTEYVDKFQYLGS